MDHERFLQEVLLRLKSGGDFSYSPYDCMRQEYGAAVFFCDNDVNIVEGSYSCHPALRDYYDLKIFLSVEPEEQIKRIKRREGDAHAADFFGKWIPMEERYIEEYRVPEYCDLQYSSL